MNQGDLEYLLNVTKFSNCTKLILGFDGNFGGKKSSLKFVGLKGEKLRNKVKIGETTYEIQAQLADHKVPDDETNFQSMGM